MLVAGRIQHIQSAWYPLIPPTEGYSDNAHTLPGNWQGVSGRESVATWPTGIINLMFIPIISPIWKALQDRRTRIAELNSNSFLASMGNQTISEWVKNKLDEAEEKRIQLWENPPLCGSVVRYAQKCGHDDAHGEFLFKTADVEQALRDSLQENPHLTNSDDGAMLHWVQGRNDSLAEPSVCAARDPLLFAAVPL